eukprot:12420230-Karenia_brevis.AAC.1
MTLEYFADQRHVEILKDQCGMNSKTKSVVTPGEKTTITPEKLLPMGPSQQEAYRSACMRNGYLALDRPDCQFSSKECARGMATPTTRHGE